MAFMAFKETSASICVLFFFFFFAFKYFSEALKKKIYCRILIFLGLFVCYFYREKYTISYFSC